MSYITSSLSPYRSDNIWKEFTEILIEENEWVCSSAGKLGFFFPIAYISIMSISLLKAIIFLMAQQLYL